MSREQRQEESDTVPNFNAKRLAHPHELTRGGVGVDDRQIHALPRMARQRAALLISDVFETTLSKVGPRVSVAGLKHGFDDGDAHGFSQRTQFGRVLGASNE